MIYCDSTDQAFDCCTSFDVSPYICHVLSSQEIMRAEEKAAELRTTISMHSAVRERVISGAMKRSVNRECCKKAALVLVPGSNGTYVPVEMLRAEINRQEAWEAKQLAARQTAMQKYPPLPRVLPFGMLAEMFEVLQWRGNASPVVRSGLALIARMFLTAQE